MKKEITKKKSVIKPKPQANWQARSKVVFFGPFLFFGFILFLMVFVLFLVNSASLCLSFGALRPHSVQGYSPTTVLTGQLSKDYLISEEPELLAEPSPAGKNSWQENELMSLADGVVSLLNVSYVSSPDGLQFAYIINSDNQAAVNLNGKTEPLYDEITFMSFSPDSRHFAYGVKMGANEAVVVDGQLQSLYDFIFPPYFFTPDSQHFVYRTRNSAGDFMVIDNQPGRAYEQTYNQFMSADGKFLIYYARIGKMIYKNTLKLGE